MFFPMKKTKKNVIKYKTIKCHHLGQSLWLNNNKYFKIIIKLLCSCGGRIEARKHVHLFWCITNVQSCSWIWLTWPIHIFQFKAFLRGRWRCSNSNSSELSLPLVQWISTLVITNWLHWFRSLHWPQNKIHKVCFLSPLPPKEIKWVSLLLATLFH
jgi:hypothetical protein